MKVPIRDTDQLRETCAGMFGGDDAFIEGLSTGIGRPIASTRIMNG
jgi:hypothetical protein